MTLCKKRSHRGFSLVEILVAMSVGLLVVMFVTSVSLSSIRFSKTSEHFERLHTNMLYINSLIGNVVRQSVALDVPNNHTIVVTLPDFSTKTITLSGDNINIDGVPINSDDVSITSFSVIEAKESVRASFGMKTGSSTVFSATTTHARRNKI